MALAIDFQRVAYPPLLTKWGGVAHPHAIHGGTGAIDPAWDSITNATLQQLKSDAQRRTPILLGIIELGHTMSNETQPIFEGNASTGIVRPIPDPMRLALRRLRGGTHGVQPMLQFSGCPTPVFRINESTVPSPRARFYPMCTFAQLDLLATSFARYASMMHDRDGLSSSWSFWAEPAHTISAALSRQGKLANMERYLDFYERVAPAIRAAVPDDVVAGWQLNAANGKDDTDLDGRPSQVEAPDHPPDIFYEATQRFLAREARRNGTRIPLDYFTVQNYQGEASISLAVNARAALCASLGELPAHHSYTKYTYDTPPSTQCSRRFALTPLYFVRFSEHKDVDPDFTRKSGTSQLLDELAMVTDLPDVAYAAHSSWEDFFSGNVSLVSPMVLMALQFYRALPMFRVPVVTAVAASKSVGSRNAPMIVGLAGYNESTQCFLLWSRSKDEQRVDVELQLLSRPVTSIPYAFKLRTLGPRHPTWIPQRSVFLPPAPDTNVSIKQVVFKPFGVISACVARGNVGVLANASSLVGTLYTRHDVLVPRVSTASVTPLGLGHYDVWRNTLVVAVSASRRHTEGDTVGVAGVILRAVPVHDSFTIRAGLALQAANRCNNYYNDTCPIVLLRVDYLNASSVLRSLRYVSGGVERASLWGGVAAAWPRGAQATGTVDFDLPPFDANRRASVQLPLIARAPSSWFNADGSSRRLRISLLMRPRRAGGSPATLQAVLSTR